MKGLGGYHLACDARNGQAVAELRRRKHRDEKPFAIMVGDLAAAEALCEVQPAEKRTAAARRAVRSCLLRKRPRLASRPAVAPGNPYLGVMLPYTPLHHLLLRRDGRHAPGDDQRQSLRRADRLRGCRRAAAAGRHRRPVPDAQSADPRPLRRFGDARGRRAGAAAAASRGYARSRSRCRCAVRGRSWQWAGSSRGRSPWAAAGMLSQPSPGRPGSLRRLPGVRQRHRLCIEQLFAIQPEHAGP